MQEAKIKISGPVVIPILIIMAVIIGLRVNSIMKGEIEPELRKALENEIRVMDVNARMQKVKDLQKTGTADQKMESMLSLTKAPEPVVKSVHTTKNIFDFSTEKQDVVVKVKFALGDQEFTEYYRFIYKPLFKNWECRGKTSKTAFYLNLI